MNARPKKPAGDVRESKIIIRVTEAEKGEIERLAKAHKCKDRSEYIRLLCLGVIAFDKKYLT